MKRGRCTRKPGEQLIVIIIGVILSHGSHGFVVEAFTLRFQLLSDAGEFLNER